MNAAEQQAFDKMRDALNELATALPIDRSTTRTCYAVNNIHRDSIHASLSAANAVSDQQGCLSNCDHCTYANASPAQPGHCYMFFEEPQGVCGKWQPVRELFQAKDQPK